MTRRRMRLPAFLLLTAAVAGCYEVDSRGFVGPPGFGVSRFAAADFFPLTSGWKWTYSVWMSGVKTREVRAVLERQGDVAVVEEGGARITYTVTPDGIAEKDGDKLGDYIIKNPLSVGAEWAVEGGRARIVSVNANVVRPRLGRLEGCLLIAVTRTDPKRVTQTWFAPHLGPVRVSVSAADGREFLTIAQAELVSVTRPGDSPVKP